MAAVTRHSEKREAIYAVLSASKRHPSAAWVYEQLRPRYPSLSLGTVYRNLAQFESQGLARVVAVVNGQERYDADMSDHAHFKCTRCGAVLDLSGDAIHEAIRACADVCPYPVSGFQLSFEGVCDACAAH